MSDDKPISYDELVHRIHTLPATWVPAVLRHLVERAIEVRAFREPDGLERFVTSTANKAMAVVPTDLTLPPEQDEPIVIGASPTPAGMTDLRGMACPRCNGAALADRLVSDEVSCPKCGYQVKRFQPMPQSDQG